MNLEKTYKPTDQKIAQLIAAGIMASLAMLITNFLIKVADIPTHPLTLGSALFLFLLGVAVLPFLFDYLLYRRALINRPYVKGALFGLAVLLIEAGIFAPLAAYGLLYSDLSESGMVVLTSLLCWVVYGLTFESLTRVRFTQTLRLVDRSRAA